MDFFIGIGFGWGPLALICQTMAWFTTRRIGRPLWDQAGGHRITANSPNPLRIVAYVFLFFAAVQLQMIVIAPYATERPPPESSTGYRRAEPLLRRPTGNPASSGCSGAGACG